MRPVLVDINQSQAAPRLSAEVSAIPLRVRLMAALPLINLITGLVVAALTSGRRRRRGAGRSTSWSRWRSRPRSRSS